MASSRGASSRKYYVLGVIGISAAASVVAHVQFSSDQEIGTVREAKADIAERGPRLEVVTAVAGPKERAVKLLGDVRSGASTTLYAKVSGYLKKVMVDKGDMVEAGAVVAEIESPELEQQYAAASADLAYKRRNLARALRSAVISAEGLLRSHEASLQACGPLK